MLLSRCLDMYHCYYLDVMTFHVFSAIDINECEDDPLCPNNLVCKDLHGSYECTCETGNIRAGDGCIRKYITLFCCVVTL